MDREYEQRRDLAHVTGHSNPMGGELFTIIKKRVYTSPTGNRVEIVESVRRNVPFGIDTLKPKA